MLRRLLIASGSGGAFPAPFRLTQVNANAAWPSVVNPHFSLGGYAYFGIADNAGGIFVVVVNETTGAVTLSTIAADGSTSNDQHNAPGLCVAADGKLVTIYSDHQSASIWRRITANTLASDPTISGGWGTATNIDSQVLGTAYTYHTLLMLGDETSDPIYAFHRNEDMAGSNWEWSKSTDNGASWATLVNLSYGTRYYAIASKSSESRVDFAICDGSYAEDFASLYHFYYEGGSLYETDGTLIGSSPPYAVSSFTKVYDGASAGVRAPASIVKLGTDIAIVWPVQTGTPSSHLGEDEDYLYARWDGASWTVNTLAADVGALTFEYTEGSLVIDDQDLDRVYVSRRATSSLSDPFHLWVYDTTDDGASWSSRQISTGATPYMYPLMVKGHTSQVVLGILSGTFTTQSDFDTALVAYGRL